MTGHKALWNAIVHSREVWPFGHPLHELDLMMMGAFLFLCFMIFVMTLEWRFCRLEHKQQSEYDRWLEEWQKIKETESEL